MIVGQTADRIAAFIEDATTFRRTIRRDLLSREGHPWEES